MRNSFDLEPLPLDHPFRKMDTVDLTPHLGDATRETLAVFYGDVPEAIAAYASGAPVRVINKAALSHERQSRFAASLAAGRPRT